MDTWFKISINGGEGYMRIANGEFAGYYSLAGDVIAANEDSSVYVTENDVQGPF